MKKVSFFSVLAVIVLASGFFVANDFVRAASSGDVVINEFSSASSPEWVELLNTTTSDISLTGWTLQDSAQAPKSLSSLGVIPANGIVVFEQASGWLNNAPAVETITIFDNTNTPIHSISYGSAGVDMVAPTAGQSGSFNGISWSISNTPARGWFNNATDYSCPGGVLTPPEGSSAPPALSSITSCLSSGVSVVTNMGSLVDSSIATNLSFEKRTDVNSVSTAIGKIVFAGPLNLTNQNTVNYLKAVGQKLDMVVIDGEVRVGLNTVASGSTESNFKTAVAAITMYGLTAIHAAPNLIVKDNSGTVIPSDDGLNYPNITSKIFDDTTHTYVFNTDHFTTFETDSISANLTNLTLSGTPASYSFAGGTYTYNGVTVSNSISSITVTPTGAGAITMSSDGGEPITLTSGVASSAIVLTAGAEKTISVIATETGKSAKTYTIKVTRSLSSAKAITAFSFPSGTGVINETAHTIGVSVPNGTNVTVLVATFITTGASISIGGTSQVSAITANDFTASKSYTATAADSSTQPYVVTVTILAATQTTPDGSGDATVDTTTPEVVITNPTQAVSLTISSGTINPTIDVSEFISGGTGDIPQITITSTAGSGNAATATIEIPATTVTSASTSWDGVIAAPTVTIVTLPNPSGETRTLSTAIELGFASAKLSFSNAVRVLLPSQAGKKVGYVRPGITFTEITNVCAADNQATGDTLGVDGDCKIDASNGLDLVVWTKHFTSFATYTQTTNSNSGSGGGGSYGQYVYQPSITPTPVSIPVETSESEILRENNIRGNLVSLSATTTPVIKTIPRATVVSGQSTVRPNMSPVITESIMPILPTEPSAQQASILGTIGNIAGLGTGSWLIALIVILAIVYGIYRLIKRRLRRPIV